MGSVATAVALAGVSALVAPCLAALTLWYVRRRQSFKQNSLTQKSRAFYLYRGMAGVLLGQVLCHTWLPVALGQLNTQLLFTCALLGYVFMDVAEGISRIWHNHSHYVTLDDDVDPDLDELGTRSNRGVETDVVALSNIGGASKTFAKQTWSLVDKERDAVKRQWMLGALSVTLGVICTVDSLLLVALQREHDEFDALVALICWCATAVALTLALLGGMVHAKLHLVAEGRARRWFWWWGVSGIYWSCCILLLGSGLPQWLAMTPRDAAFIMEQPAFAVVYGGCTGMLLKLQQYYYHRRLHGNCTRRDILGGLLVFVLAAAQSAVTGFWI